MLQEQPHPYSFAKSTDTTPSTTNSLQNHQRAGTGTRSIPIVMQQPSDTHHHHHHHHHTFNNNNDNSTKISHRIRIPTQNKHRRHISNSIDSEVSSTGSSSSPNSSGGGVHDGGSSFSLMNDRFVYRGDVLDCLENKTESQTQEHYHDYVNNNSNMNKSLKDEDDYHGVVTSSEAASTPNTAV